MKVTLIPDEKLLDLEDRAPGLLDAIGKIVDNDGVPSLEVLREKTERKPSRWSLRVTGADNPIVLALDSTSIQAMSVAMPIYLVQMVRELHDENPLLVAAGLRIGLQSMLPFLRAGLGGVREN